MAGPNYGGQGASPATVAPQVIETEESGPRKRRGRRASKSTQEPVAHAAGEMLRQADAELMRAQAMLLVCEKAVLNPEAEPDVDGFTLASLLSSVRAVIAGAVGEVENAQLSIAEAAK